MNEPLLYRFITSVELGGAVPNIIALISEYAPADALKASATPWPSFSFVPVMRKIRRRPANRTAGPQLTGEGRRFPTSDM